ncbi:MAG: STAS domain-containing protein [Pseudomonadota bacterium]
MRVEKLDGVTILITDKRLDTADGSTLRDLVKDLAEEEGLKLVIDMEKTDFIDSWGCAGLLLSLKNVAKNHGNLIIARPSQQVLSVIYMTRLHRVFEIRDSLEEAIASFLPAEDILIQD